MFRKLLIACLTLTFFLTACGSAQPTPQPTSVPTQVPPTAASIATTAPTAAVAPIVLTDGLGREVTLASPAQRVVSLAPSNTEILFAVGAGAQVVGRDEFSDYPEEAKSVASIGGSMGQYSLEAITALRPDLVLASGLNSPELVKSLEDLDLTVFYLPNPTTLEEMYANLLTVAQLTGREAQAVTLIESLKARVAAVDQKVATISSHPSVFYELDSTDPGKPYTAGPDTFVTLLIERAGGVNVGANLDSAWAQISLEQLVVYNPDMIILGDSLFGTTPESVKGRPGWQELQAVQQDQIYPFDDNLVSRPGPRLVDGLEQLAKLLHPDAFK